MMDFHAHLDLFDDPQSIARLADEQGIYVLSVTTTPSAFLGTKHLAKGYRRIRTALGMHPQIAADRLHELSLFDRLIVETDYVGEIGLDGSSEYKSTLSSQRKAFLHILKKSEEVGGRVLSIHSRGASSEVIETLKLHTKFSTPILHWFTGSPSEIGKATDIGCWFSIGPAMLKSERLKEKASFIPKSRVLLESDGPFAKYSGKSLSPLDTHIAIPLLAEVWKCEEDEVIDQLHANLKVIGNKARHKVS